MASSFTDLIRSTTTRQPSDINSPSTIWSERACVGDWIVYYEPRKVVGTKGYYAVAKVERVIPDPSTPEMYLALIEPGSCLDFATPVPVADESGPIERGVLNKSERLLVPLREADRPHQQFVRWHREHCFKH